MQVRYTVHSAVEEKIATTATLPNGQVVSALVDGMTVELVEIDGSDTLTRRVIPEDMEAAKALFVVGAEIIATLAAAPVADDETE